MSTLANDDASAVQDLYLPPHWSPSQGSSLGRLNLAQHIWPWSKARAGRVDRDLNVVRRARNRRPPYSGRSIAEQGAVVKKGADFQVPGLGRQRSNTKRDPEMVSLFTSLLDRPKPIQAKSVLDPVLCLPGRCATPE
jgi:hypothetical protein